jgi:hypothetical protein
MALTIFSCVDLSILIRSYAPSDYNKLYQVSNEFKSKLFGDKIWNFTMDASARYMQSPIFRAYVESKIDATQLTINYRPIGYMVPLPLCTAIAYAATRVCAFHLNLSNRHTKIANVNMLRSLRSLNISGNEIIDIRAFANIHTLVLSRCPNIIDVSSLMGVHTLDLSHCDLITDVSMLGRVHKLDLSGCIGVRDVSALRFVHDLNLSFCTQIDNVSHLGNVQKLNLWGCDRILDISMLSIGYIHPPHHLRNIIIGEAAERTP